MKLDLLRGLKVIQVGERVSIAFCGKILAAMGADVIMVEPVVKGNSIRSVEPFYENIPGLERSIFNNWINSNKRSIALRLQDKEGKKILHNLIHEADVLVTEQLPTDRSRQALNYNKLRNNNQKLVITSVTPFGMRGPYAKYSSSELTLFSMSGYDFYLSSPVDDPANTPPKQNPGYQVSYVAGLIAATATLYGILTRNKKGRLLDISEWETIVSILFDQPAYYSSGILSSTRGRGETGKTSGVIEAGGLVWCLPCSDGWVLISPREDHQFKSWGEIMGSPEWVLREELSTREGRKQNSRIIQDYSAAWTITQIKEEVHKKAQNKKVPCFPVSVIGDLLKMDQLNHRGFWDKIEHPLMKGVIYPGLPMRTNSNTTDSQRAPFLGEHTIEICKELGIFSNKIDVLLKNGVLGEQGGIARVE